MLEERRNGMKKEFINLMKKSNLKYFLANPQNIRQLKYFINTFINLPSSFKLNEIEVIFQSIINNYSEKERKSTSDLIIKSRRDIIVINSYTTNNKEYIIHMLIGSLDNEQYRLRELRFCHELKEKEVNDIVTDYYLQSSELPNNDTFKDLLQIKTINLKRLNELSSDTAINRWLKFIGATNNEERIKATNEDEILKDFNL